MSDYRNALPAGYQLQHYRIEAVLGKGGFGITYLAEDLRSGSKAALKELLPDTIATRVDSSTVVPHSSSQQESWLWAKDRFSEEARVLSGFNHRAIVRIYELIEANGTAYMVMEHIEGESFEARLKRIGWESSQESLWKIIGPLMDGLGVVHSSGFLHRDIKPDNILIRPDGKPVLIDFGSAREAVSQTVTMTSIVTHGYSPIEQYQTKGRVGPWTDIYALGAVMCRAITGEKPPAAPDRIGQDDFTWLRFSNPGSYSVSFLGAIDWALQVNSEDRPQQVTQIRPYLEGDVDSLPPQLGDAAEEAPAKPYEEKDYVSAFETRRPSGMLRGGPIVGISLIALFLAGILLSRSYETPKQEQPAGKQDYGLVSFEAPNQSKADDKSGEERCREIALRRWPDNPKLQSIVYEEQLAGLQYMKTASEQDVKAIALRQQPDDYSTQKYVYDQQISAKQYMATSATDPEAKQIAVRKHPDDYSMQEHDYRQQVSAKQYMATSATDPELKQFAVRKHPDDYSMQRFTYDQQTLDKQYMATSATDPEVKQLAVRAHHDDYSTQKYVYDQQVSAKQYMATSATDPEVKQFAVRAHHDDYSTQKYVYDKQMSAKQYMAKIPESDIKLQVSQEHPGDYSMQKYNYDRFSTGRR